LTYGASIAYTPNMKWAVTENYFAGPVIDLYPTEFAGRTTTDWKQLEDATIAYTPNSKWAFQVNGDYGFGPKYYSCDETCTASPAVSWWGVAGYAKYTLSPKTNFAARYEYYEDPNGYTGLLDGDKGHAQEVTGTYSYNLTSALLIRGEYRYDFAGLPIFEKGGPTPRFVKEQNTAYISFVYSFSSANMK